jgi:ribonucleoside-triphosphate reductase
MEKLDAIKFTEDFLRKRSWLVRENANIPFSFSNLFFRGAGEVVTRYMLTKIYPKQIAKAHIDGDMHIHNLYMGMCPYCGGWDLKQILLEGLGGVPLRLSSAPPKHLRTAVHQMVNFAGIIQNEFAGAIAFNSVDIFLAPFVRKDRLGYKEVKQCIQEFVFGVNVTARWGGQTPFLNITLDWVIPTHLAKEKVVIGGELRPNRYGEYQSQVDMINRAFLEVMLRGDAAGRVFTFPLLTVNLTKEFDWDSRNARLLFELAGRYGVPYFQNFIKSDLDPKEIHAMCCRLLIDKRELYRRYGGYFGFATKTGSIGVVTINMPRIAYLAKDEADFFKRLAYVMELAKESLEIKRKLVQHNIDIGLLPYTKRYLGTLMWHFSTIGLIGMNEACLNFLGVDIASREGQAFAMKVLKFMRDKIIQYQEETGNIYNIEATPAESCSYRLAKLDKQRYPKIITAGEKVPYYTNSTWLPVDYTDDLWFALKHQEPLQVLYTGGTIFHAFLGERVDAEACKLLVRKIATTFRIPYFTITPTFSICPDHGYLSGEQWKCPTCGKDTEVYSRVVGYLRPVQSWNPGKQEEFKQRKTYKVKGVLAV